MSLYRLTLVLVLAYFSACQDRSADSYDRKLEREGNPDVISVADEDPEMEKAFREAWRTYPDFLKALQAADSGSTHHQVKRRFVQGKDTTEYMWVTDLYFKGDKLFGILNNEPAYITSAVIGDTLEIVADSIVDWMYVREGKMVGGFTTKVLYRKMSVEERKELDGQLPYKID